MRINEELAPIEQFADVHVAFADNFRVSLYQPRLHDAECGDSRRQAPKSRRTRYGTRRGKPIGDKIAGYRHWLEAPAPHRLRSVLIPGFTGQGSGQYNVNRE